MSFKCRFGVLDVRGLGFRDFLCMSLVLVCGLNFENVVAGFFYKLYYTMPDCTAVYGQ